MSHVRFRISRESGTPQQVLIAEGLSYVLATHYAIACSARENRSGLQIEPQPRALG
jgi:hypothetical protein